MKLFFKNIALTLLASVFLISSTGFTVFKHICLGCDITKTSLINKSNCKHDSENKKPKTCCSAKIHKHQSKESFSKKCCIDKLLYYKLEIVYSNQTKTIYNPVFEFDYIDISLNINQFHPLIFNKFYQTKAPPVKTCGKDILLKSCILLI